MSRLVYTAERTSQFCLNSQMSHHRTSLVLPTTQMNKILVSAKYRLRKIIQEKARYGQGVAATAPASKDNPNPPPQPPRQQQHRQSFDGRTHYAQFTSIIAIHTTLGNHGGAERPEATPTVYITPSIGPKEARTTSLTGLRSSKFEPRVKDLRTWANCSYCLESSRLAATPCLWLTFSSDTHFQSRRK
jgi:hypothetical protein